MQSSFMQKMETDQTVWMRMLIWVRWAPVSESTIFDIMAHIYFEVLEGLYEGPGG